MSIRIAHQSFATMEEAQAAVQISGLHCAELAVPPVENSSHWHQFHAELYVLDGDLLFTDVATDTKHSCGPGSHIVVPPRSLHAERSLNGYRIVLGTSVLPPEFGDPVNKLPSELND